MKTTSKLIGCGATLLAFAFQLEAQTSDRAAQPASQQAGATLSDSQVTTFLQQLDAEGPEVSQRVAAVVGDLACTPETSASLVEALHSGKTFAVTSEVNGRKKSGTFNASGTHLGYGETYIAIALAARELRNAGVKGCATPEQWQAVLLGGPLTITDTSTTPSASASASASRPMPGVVTLHSKGQSWGRIAQANNVQLGQLFNSTPATSSLAPTGRASNETTPSGAPAKDESKGKGDKKHWDKEDKAAERNAETAAPSQPDR